MTHNDLTQAAQVLGRKGGSSTSPAKQQASRENGKKGGRPVRQYQVSVATGAAAWDCARKFAELYHCEVVYRQRNKLILHSPTGYREGLPGDYGFCNATSTHALTQPGVWLVVGAAGWKKAAKVLKLKREVR